MAFLVCYCSEGTIDWKKKAVYLEQSFYELFFEHCAGISEFPVLDSIISLDYDQDIIVTLNQLEELRLELTRASALSQAHRQPAMALLEIVERAQESGAGLAFAGDMHPVLSL